MASPMRNLLHSCNLNKLAKNCCLTAAILPKVFASTRGNSENSSRYADKLNKGPSLADFIKNDQHNHGYESSDVSSAQQMLEHSTTDHPYVDGGDFHGGGRKGRYIVVLFSEFTFLFVFIFHIESFTAIICFGIIIQFNIFN